MTTTEHETNIFDDETVEPLAPLDLYQESAAATRVRPAPSDTIGFATLTLTDSTTAAPQAPVRILEARPNGVASKVTIGIHTVAGAAGKVYLLRSVEDYSTALDGAGAPYCPYGYHLGSALTGGTVELTTTEHVYAVCVAGAVGVGAVISVCSEIYFAD